MHTTENAEFLSTLSRVQQNIADNCERKNNRMNEKETIHFLVEPLIAAIGWGISDIEQVRREYPTINGGMVDIALMLDGSPTLFVEARALGHSIDNMRLAEQIVDYASSEGVNWCILTNGAEYRIFNSRLSANIRSKRFINVTLSELSAKSIAEILFLISPQAMKENLLETRWNETYNQPKSADDKNSLEHNK